MTLSTLGDVTTHVAVGGSADVVLMKHRAENRMTPVLRYRGITGTEYAVELATADVVSLMRSLVVMFSAELPEIGEWWQKLTAAQLDRDLDESNDSSGAGISSSGLEDESNDSPEFQPAKG